MSARSLDPEIAAFYTAQSAFSDPGVFAPRYAGLPAEPVRLAEAARGLMIHRLEGPVFGYEIPQDRLHRDAETRYVDEILRIILDRDDAPLHRPRAIADRFVGVCRDFALLLCSFLRHFGVPARLRIGFADYLGPAGFHYDHVVTEYWDAERGWRAGGRAAARPPGRRRPRDRLRPYGRAPRPVPRLRRRLAARPRGRGRPGHLRAARRVAGEWWFPRNVRLDLAAVNRAETLLWDWWGPDPGPFGAMTDAVRELFDEAALLTGDEVPFAAARERFTARDDLRPPRTVVTWGLYHGRSRSRCGRSAVDQRAGAGGAAHDQLGLEQQLDVLAPGAVDLLQQGGTAAVAIAPMGLRTVVSGGSVNAISGESSKPTTDTSPRHRQAPLPGRRGSRPAPSGRSRTRCRCSRGPAAAPAAAWPPSTENSECCDQLVDRRSTPSSCAIACR